MNKTITTKKSNAGTSKKSSADNELSAQPDKQVIENILNYSKALKVTKSKSIGHIEEVKN